MRYIHLCIAWLIFTAIGLGHQAAKSKRPDKPIQIPPLCHKEIRNKVNQQTSGVLFVEDPGVAAAFGPAVKPDPQWESVLDELLGVGNYGWYSCTTGIIQDGPALDTLQEYDLVIWNTYDFWWHGNDTMALTETDQNNLASYLQSGGQVWLIGQDLLFSGVPFSWMSNFFHLDTAYQDYRGLWDPDTLLISGLNALAGMSCTTVTDYQENGFFADELIPDAQAFAVLEDVDSSKTVGILYTDADWNSAFWAVDGRITLPQDQWVAMVETMLTTFGIQMGIEEESSRVSEGMFVVCNPVMATATTDISYEIPFNAHTVLSVYDKTGRHIRTLVDAYVHEGRHSIQWNGKDATGSHVSEGVYFIRLVCGADASTAKIIVIK